MRLNEPKGTEKENGFVSYFKTFFRRYFQGAKETQEA
jgi:hypothetical protein